MFRTTIISVTNARKLVLCSGANERLLFTACLQLQMNGGAADVNDVTL